MLSCGHKKHQWKLGLSLPNPALSPSLRLHQDTRIGEPASFVAEIPHGYRDRKWISSAHEAGNLNSLGAVLGNDVALNAYREGKLPFPDGTIIRLLPLCITVTSRRRKTTR